MAVRQETENADDSDKKRDTGFVDTILMCSDVTCFFGLPIGVIIVTVLATNAIT